MVLRPATPGFVVTLAATICLALVSFSTPLLKSIYFLSATINHDSLQGTATFGVLGYCLQTGTAQACSNATVGWEFGVYISPGYCVDHLSIYRVTLTRGSTAVGAVA
jgi:hypothetical protein